ncbi:CAP domain-containing protein [uncultured Sphingomonas sp.]|uniref:CAP domain-containing protein n=1 Tax=uncultured Sphingomonas sp. TaxID=158754 RepID=UPI0025F33442|nr:CAP domain-containing protein [uncultured Sphingomonas sp.]
MTNRLQTVLILLCGMLLAAGAAAPAAAETPYEQAVLAELNAARSNPAAYLERLRGYRAFFHDKLIYMPGLKAAIQTEEGVGVVNETIAFLDRQRPLDPVRTAGLLRTAAADHVAEQAESGSTGHGGEDGSSPGDRVERRGGGAYVAEVIAYGSIDPADVVRQLIVDDGVPDRGHRSVLFSPELRFAGVSCGTHPEYRTMCVIDLGITAEGRFPDKQPLVVASR